ncbi:MULTISPECIES: sensor of ECF-type sigma factor [Mesoflavibacter]|uniref:Sensor of ECF-type sigma factor n=1 Tax=Mesoflavibacter profundi TaxID=2708110 RepID=A0ABT4RYW1_9FLAO|nr:MULTISPECIES: sensor of ECF-type sigma factor [Mesoflavibacter]MDA0177012.1 sensor of ECF-type sigma factor [Mesoflavibacter profundi]QIJ87927.1 hypothetical protein C7H62_0117 [Mesoflavibacter sp. HG96]QIJ90655.1 hypothetical protein C7H56_0117 [Mesoflavibacter sp. HG37]
MKTSIILFFSILFSITSIAQDKREKLKALKVAHITEQLNLTTKEAENFWPIYNAHEDEKHKIYESSLAKRKEINIEKLSEKEAESLLKEMQDFEEAKLKSEKNLVDKLSKIISYKKIVKLMHAERTFKRKIIEEYRGRHREMRKN